MKEVNKDWERRGRVVFIEACWVSWTSGPNSNSLLNFYLEHPQGWLTCISPRLLLWCCCPFGGVDEWSTMGVVLMVTALWWFCWPSSIQLIFFKQFECLNPGCTIVGEKQSNKAGRFRKQKIESEVLDSKLERIKVVLCYWKANKNLREPEKDLAYRSPRGSTRTSLHSCIWGSAGSRGAGFIEL